MKKIATEADYRAARERSLGDDGYDRELVTFRLADGMFALDVAWMSEIIQPRPVTEVPRVPHFVLGILIVRGEVATVVDLRLRLEVPAHPATRTSRILVARLGGQVYGLVVDEVHKVLRVRDRDLRDDPRPGMLAVVDDEGETVVLLDLPEVVRFDPR